MNFNQIAQVCQGNVLQFSNPEAIQNLCLDSRQWVLANGTLFFAIRGRYHDGHQFIAELYQRGVRHFVVEHVMELTSFSKANFMVVDKSIDALQKIAAHHRAQFNIPIIGITGSNAKTIVKEWLAQLLATQISTVKSPKSYNSQIGVPLSVWQLNAKHEVGVFEAGISQPEEMQCLADIIQPTIGVFTNIGSAHDEGFKDRHHKITEKAKLFKSCEQIIYCKDHQEIHDYLVTYYPHKCMNWSTKDQQATIFIQKDPENEHKLSITYRNKTSNVNLPFIDAPSQENIFHCITVLLSMDFTVEEITDGLAQLQPISMRLALKEAIHQCYLIDDSYNNDLGGLEMAISYLHQQHQRPGKSIILSDVYESGLEPNELYKKISALVNALQPKLFFGIGPQLSSFKHLFPAQSQFFESTDAFLQGLQPELFNEEIILVKGARAFQFERIVHQLQKKLHRTVLEVNLDALASNLNYFRSHINADTKLMVMIKAFAYGSGFVEVAQFLQYHLVDYLAVAYTDEGITLRNNGIRLPIMVMNPTPDDVSKLQQYELEPEVYCMRLLEALTGNADQHTEPMKIHLKLDTGMHRLGFVKEELDALVAVLKKQKRFKVQSIFSHLAASDDLPFSK